MALNILTFVFYISEAHVFKLSLNAEKTSMEERGGFARL